MEMSMKIFFPISMYRMKVNGLATTMNIFKFVAVSPESCSRHCTTLPFTICTYMYHTLGRGEN